MLSPLSCEPTHAKLHRGLMPGRSPSETHPTLRLMCSRILAKAAVSPPRKGVRALSGMAGYPMSSSEAGTGCAFSVVFNVRDNVSGCMLPAVHCAYCANVICEFVARLQMQGRPLPLLSRYWDIIATGRVRKSAEMFAHNERAHSERRNRTLARTERGPVHIEGLHALRTRDIRRQVRYLSRFRCRQGRSRLP